MIDMKLEVFEVSSLTILMHVNTSMYSWWDAHEHALTQNAHMHRTVTN